MTSHATCRFDHQINSLETTIDWFALVLLLCVFFSFKISRKLIERPNINELVLHCLVALTRFHTLKLTPEDHWDFVA